ncbi:MAG: hypothetical protein HY791_01455 [Deltaproteobacteria bacterium]|nr:hypothetical protein [Deltaproteobacteria bacterium]
MRISPKSYVSRLLLVAGLGCGAEASLPEGQAPDPSQVAKTQRELSAQCFWGKTAGGQTVPLSRIVREIVATDLGTVVRVSVVFNREFVDNTYGANAIGWTNRRHAFKDLVGSDHVELSLSDARGDEKFRSKLDYISTSRDWNSGYGNLGVTGGDGKLLLGDAGDVVSTGSSLADNINVHGYALTTDSPATDAQYTPNPEYPEWNFWVEYRVSVKTSAFGSAGFGRASMQFVHASPSKFEKANTVEVFPGDCPTPTSGSGPTPFPACVRADLDTECGECDADGCSREEGEPDPGADSPNPLDDPDPSGSEECTRSGDCGPSAFCDEGGRCAEF